MFVLPLFRPKKAARGGGDSPRALAANRHSGSPEAITSIGEARRVLESILTNNIIPFWYPGVLDRQDGGYCLNHALDGKWLGPAHKSLVAQTRTLWFFSRLARSSYSRPEYLQAAHQGYEFLRAYMLDADHGGFYWEVDASGRTATQPEKHVYGQAFALYALVEYARASHESSAATLAKTLFNVLEDQPHDNRYGGYGEIFQRDWTVPRGETRSAYHRTKRMNTHLHLMEAITAFLSLTGEVAARERLMELIMICSELVVRKDLGCCSDRHHEDWRPLRGHEHKRVSYGHDLENIWLLMEASHAADRPANLLLDLYARLFNYALRYGFDSEQGGFYDSGPFNAPADQRQKTWWVQAEALLAALKMSRLTGESVYWQCFSRTLDWVAKHQIDTVNGEWFETVGVDLQPSGVKAGPWKCPYHNSRAMLQCLEMLDPVQP
jgi:mannobiose 2-epimerase